MDALEALRTRRSVRLFKEDPVPRELVEEIVDCGRLAPSAMNLQPWEFVAVTDSEVRRKIADTTDHGKFIADAPLCVAVLCQEGKYYLEDGSNASTAILTAAHAAGLGGCWVAGDKKEYADSICKLLGAPERFRLVSLLAIGYPAESPEKEKRSLDQVLHWEKF